jgi:AcrR family transcriptional regulator
MTSSPPRSRGAYRNGELQRERILASATEIFGRHGFAGATLRKIAADVGVVPAAILLHFGSKEGLLLSVLARWGDLTTATGAGVHGLEYLRRLNDVMRDHMAERGFIELFSTMSTEASNPAHPAHDFMRNRYEGVRSRLERELTTARESGEIAELSDAEAAHLARQVIAVMDGLQIQWLLDPELDLAGEFRLYIESVVARLT